MAVSQTDNGQRPLLGVVLATALTLYGIIAHRREQDQALGEWAGEGERGRHAESPEQISAAGWWDIVNRVLGNVGGDNLSLMSAGMAFYAMLSLTPAFTALISLYGLVFNPADVQTQIAALGGVIPDEARKLISDQLTMIAQGNHSKLGIGLVVSLMIALWSANSGISALMSALNITYSEEEKRNLWTFWAHSLLLTFSLILFGVLSLILVAIVPAIIGFLPLGEFGRELVRWARWPVLILLSSIGLAAIYRYAPSRNEPRWRWVSWGALAATLLWVVGSALFSIYVSKFASYDKTYGSLGAVVVLLMWFYLTAFAILLGGELNAEMEHQTMRDTTDRPRKPMGARGAYVADTVARSR